MEQRPVIELIDAGDIDGLRRALAEDPAAATARDPEGLSALMHAIYHRRRDVIDALLSYRLDELDIFEASALGEADRLASLLASDASLAGVIAPDGFQPLHLAAYFGHLALVRELIARGADVNAVARNPSQVQPLHSAVSGRNGAIVELLLEAGSDPNAQQAHGWTALHSAAHQGNMRLVELLLENGADPAVAAENGELASDMARQARYFQLAHRLDVPTSAS